MRRAAVSGTLMAMQHMANPMACSAVMCVLLHTLTYSHWKFIYATFSLEPTEPFWTRMMLCRAL